MPESESSGQETWTARWAGGLATDVSAPRGHEIRVDEPEWAGGGDTGPMPTELLTAGLASCFCLAFAWAAGKRHVELEELVVRVKAHREPGKPRYECYDVWVSASPRPEQMDRLLELASRFCWVSNTLRTPPEIRYREDDGSKS